MEKSLGIEFLDFIELIYFRCLKYYTEYSEALSIYVSDRVCINHIFLDLVPDLSHVEFSIKITQKRNLQINTRIH